MGHAMGAAKVIFPVALVLLACASLGYHSHASTRAHISRVRTQVLEPLKPETRAPDPRDHGTDTPTASPTLTPLQRGCTMSTTDKRLCKFPFYYKGQRFFDCTDRHIDRWRFDKSHPKYGPLDPEFKTSPLGLKWCGTSEPSDEWTFSWGFCQQEWDCSKAKFPQGSTEE